MIDAAGVDLCQEDPPEWLPEDYDPEASLRDRLEAAMDIDGGIELVAKGEDGVEIHAGEPQELTENHAGSIRVKCGQSISDWDYEIVVPAEAEPRLESVDPGQEIEDYWDSRSTELKDIDVRIYGVDTDYFRRPLHKRLSGLRPPRHIFDEYGQWMCGVELPDDHRRLVENSDPEQFARLDDYVDEKSVNPVSVVNGLCGNCLRSYLANYDDERLEMIVEEAEEVEA